jgi:pilus assembly protein CpaF
MTTTPPPAAPGYDARRQALHNRLVEGLNLKAVFEIPEDRRRAEMRTLIDRMLDSEPGLALAGERQRMIAEMLDDVLGLGPLEPLLHDPTVSDILVNGAHEVYVDRRGRLELTEVRFRDDAHVLQVLDRIVSRLGRRIDETSPMVDARLADGSRVNAVIPPLALKGPTISIRRFGTKPLTLDDLLRFKMLTPEMAKFFEATIKARMNVVISGGTGSGKTTLLNTLSRFIPDGERVVTIEDAAELQLQQRHVVPLETRPPNTEGKGQVTTRDLLRNCLRMRPDRIVVGECRGGEAFDMLQAMNTGHDGSLTTLHANTPRDALSRLETMIMMAGFELPVKAMRQQISSAVNLIIQVSRLQGGVRKVTSVTEVLGMEADVIILQDIFEYRKQGVRETGKAYGQFRATGVRPACVPRMEAANTRLPADLFAERVLMADG